MDLKNAVAVCLISLCSATLVVLIARSLDRQAAARLEPQLARIVEELEAIRSAGGITTSAGQAAKNEPLRDGLLVYYFHGNTRCPTCQAIQSQAHETVQADFAGQLASGEMAWKTVNYEEPAASGLAAQFEIQMPVVVLARMKEGQVEDWHRLDQVWGLVGDKAAFAEFIRNEIRGMLAYSGQGPASPQSSDAPTVPVPSAETDGLPLPAGPQETPVRE